MPLRHEGTKPFAALESALAFMHLLSAEIVETMADVRRDLDEAYSGPDQRRVEALQLVDYKLQQLSIHTGKSERLLRDLSRLRTLILDSRSSRRPETVVDAAAVSAGAGD